MVKMNKKIFTVLIIFILLISGTLAVSYAANSSNLDEINEKINRANTELNGIKKDMSATMQQVTSLISEISNYESEINRLSGELDTLANELEQKEVELEKAEDDCQKQDESLKARLIVLYEAGETSYIDVLLNSESLTDFISNYYLIEQLAEYDTELLEKLEKARNEIEAAKKAVEEKKVQIEETKKNKEATNNSLKQSKSVKDAQVQKLTEEEKEKQQQLEEYEEDKKAIEAELRRQSQNNNSAAGNIYPGGTLAWPVPASRTVSCEFRGYSGHNGMDISASSGSTIVAINDGVVTTSTAIFRNGRYASYGEYIIINHGGGVVSLYAHGLAGSRKVQTGDVVTKGQPIMQVGSTGNSTGPHLHLEIVMNGSYVNPRNQF